METLTDKAVQDPVGRVGLNAVDHVPLHLVRAAVAVAQRRSSSGRTPMSPRRVSVLEPAMWVQVPDPLLTRDRVAPPATQAWRRWPPAVRWRACRRSTRR